MDSLIFLARLYPSLPIIWKLLWLVGWKALLPPREGSNLAAQATQSGRQAGVHLPHGEMKQFISGRQSISYFPGRHSPSLWGREQFISGRCSPSPCWGKLFQSRSVKVPGQAGNILGAQLGKGPSRLPRGTALPPRQTVLVPGIATPHLPPNRLPQGSSPEDPNPKWVINLSNKPLTPAQRSVLAKGHNFAVSPKQPPNLEYITAIEAACTKLS